MPAGTGNVLVAELHKALLGYYEHGRKVVLMIDEAHLIRSAGTFEELRLLLNCQMNDQFLINLILLEMARSNFRAKLAQKIPALEQQLGGEAASSSAGSRSRRVR